MKKHHAYVIEWIDSCTLGGWHPVDSPSNEISTITTIGWEVRKTKEATTFSTSIGCIGNAVDSITIPNRCIVRKKKLKYRVSRR